MTPECSLNHCCPVLIRHQIQRLHYAIGTDGLRGLSVDLLTVTCAQPAEALSHRKVFLSKADSNLSIAA
jgi:hypothetical protein